MASTTMMAARINTALVLALVACGGGMDVPETETSCANGDEDMDGLADCDDPDCAADPLCLPVTEACTGGADEDGDTFIDCEDDDCWDDPACYKVDDDTDLPAPNGDPSADIDKAFVSLAAGTATFFATFDGDWPPPAGTYSWYILFEIDNDGNTPVASVVVQQHDGVPATNVLGVSAANVALRQSPRGIWVRFTGVPSIGEKYYIESGIQKKNPGTRVTDTVVSAPAPLP